MVHHDSWKDQRGWITAVPSPPPRAELWGIANREHREPPTPLPEGATWHHCPARLVRPAPSLSAELWGTANREHREPLTREDRYVSCSCVADPKGVECVLAGTVARLIILACSRRYRHVSDDI